jgi:hypothetical protein
MPQQIKMQMIDRNAILKNVNYNSPVIPNTLKQVKLGSILNSPMINIVHNSKPGCSSCGH